MSRWQVASVTQFFLQTAYLTLAVTVCGASSAIGQNALAVRQTQYELRAGEAIPVAAPQETINFLANAKRRNVEIVMGEAVGETGGAPAVAGGRLVAGPNRAGDQILLGASLRMNPGEYTIQLSATSAGGEERQTTLDVVVKPRVSVPSGSTRPPVVLLNGWETGFTGACPIAASASDDFGNLAQYLVGDGVPVVYLFDNCLEDPGQTVEILGNDLGIFLNSITYDNGAQVPQIDLVGFSLGGLIARAYLAGLQPNQILTPPTTTLVRDLVLIATPNFGSFAAGNFASTILPGSQSAELEPGSAFLWNLATWNQRTDDLRGVNALAVIGNAGAYSPNLASGVVLANASDGLVSLTSAALGFADQQAAVTRIVPYCHVDPGTFTNTALGVFVCNAVGIANVNSTNQETGLIVRSFLAGTADWQSIGSTPASDPYLSKNGALYFALVNGADSYVADMTGVTFGGNVPLVNGADTGTIFYVDFVFGTGALAAQSASLGAINCGSFAEPSGYTSATRCKLAAAIFSVGPLTGTGGKAVNAGSAITITGSGFGSQCNACRVVAAPSGSTTGQQLTVTAWSNTSIKATLPASLTGLLTVQVYAASGTDAIAVMTISQSTLAVSPASLQFAYASGGRAPAAQSIQIANSGSGTLTWTATASTSWISVSPASGTAPSTLSVSISPAGLSAGTYTGSIQIAAAGASNSPASIGVTLTVAESPPVLVVAPLELTFQYTYGGALPAAQNVAITNAGGGTLAWTASTSAYWLGVSSATGGAPGMLAVSVNPANLAAGTYTGSLQIAAAGVVGSPAPVAVTLVVTGTQPVGTITGVANDASFQPAFAGATWLAIFGTNLSQTSYTWQAGDFVNGQLPTSLEGVSVTINGIQAYPEYISPTQINVLAPDDATVGTVQIQVTAAQQNSNSFSAKKAQFAPAFFTIGGGAYVAALHADYSLVGAPNLLPGVVTQPAKPGETILLYGTGFGPANPPLPSAQVVTAPEPLANPVKISIGGMTANVTFGGLAGSGLYQFNVTVPNLPNGDAAVLATIGGVATQTGVSVTVQQ
jgi:uncharacterized protein (TIGR03437 family)